MSALAAATAADPLLLHPINATAIATLAIFIVTVAAVVGLALRPVTLRLRAPACLRLPRPQIAIPLRAWGAPPAGALCMLAAGALNGPSIAAGLRGDGDIQPYTILVLFLSLAYAALALDQTGALAWLALRLTRAARSGHALLALHTALAGGITLLTSNDVVVMSLTPIVYVQAAAGGAEPTPYLAAEFVAANLYSMALFIGNPTNLIAAQAFNLSFLEYSKWMVAPTVAAGIAASAVLFFTHRKDLPPALAPPATGAAAPVLVDPLGAILIAAALLACLGAIAAAPSIGAPIWAISFGCAVVVAAYNVVAYVIVPHARAAARRRALRGRAAGGAQSEAELLPHVAPRGPLVSSSTSGAVAATIDANAVRGGGGDGDNDSGRGGASSPTITNGHQRFDKDLEHGSALPGAVAPPDDAPQVAAVCGDVELRPMGAAQQQHLHRRGSMPPPDAAAAEARSPSVSKRHSGGAHSAHAHGGADAALPSPTPAPDAADAARALLAELAARRPAVLAPLAAVPWDCAPLILGFFLLIEGLARTGWVDRLGAGLGAASRTLAGSLWVHGAVSVVLAAVTSNQPMTILLVRASLSPAFAAAAGAAAGTRLRAALLAVVIGSNTAACFTAIGALAGILWVSIVKRAGIHVSFGMFTRLMLPAGLAATVAALATLHLEAAFFPE